jgi:hypothetical protein
MLTKGMLIHERSRFGRNLLTESLFPAKKLNRCSPNAVRDEVNRKLEICMQCHQSFSDELNARRRTESATLQSTFIALCTTSENDLLIP